MERIQIEALTREKSSKGSRNELRKKGMIPAVVYGRGTDSKNITMDSIALKRVLSTAAGANVLFDLTIKDKNGVSKETVMVKELQRDPIQKDLFLHADLIRISMKDKLEVEVPLNFTGEARGVKEGGIFSIQLREVPIRCLPGDIPQHIDVPIDNLAIGDVLTLADIKLPEGIEILAAPEENIASVLAPQEEKAAEEEAELEGEAGGTAEEPTAE